MVKRNRGMPYRPCGAADLIAAPQLARLQPRHRVGVVRRQVDRRLLAAVGEDPVDRGDGDARLGPDGVGAPGEELLERVGRVAGQHHVMAVVVDADDRDVADRVAGGRDDHDPPVVGQRPARREAAERAAVECVRLPVDAGRDGLLQHPRKNRAPAVLVNASSGSWTSTGPVEVDRAVHVIAVHVGQHDGVDVVQRQAGGRQCAGQLVLGRDRETGERDVVGRRDLAGVDQDQLPVVLDRPAVDRERLRHPRTGSEERELAADAGLRIEECVAQLHRPGAQGVDSHRRDTSLPFVHRRRRPHGP